MPPAETHAHTNRLIHATSPYLLQHAHNPIDWYEWGAEAFRKAEQEDKPIFLSIGYAACHWCHVMEHETFEREDVADAINDKFVCIKVDREERPDVDEIYMQVTMALNQGNGGWPMSVWLMPDRRPIYAGTYLPRAQFLMVCQRIHELWNTQRDQIREQGARIQEYLDTWAAGQPADESVIAQDFVDQLAHHLARFFDVQRGGFESEANKFPPSMAMELMLRVGTRRDDPSLIEPVEVTLAHMARGGIYDQLGGGICRYSTDPEWLVPHFEKMLYDQALVSAIYLDAYQVTGKRFYADVARDIFNYVLTDLRAPQGGFYSTRDADSEGLEGAYYVWTVKQVKDVLGEDDGELFCRYYDVTESGNWFESRGHAPAGPKNILHVSKPPEMFCKLHGMNLDTFNAKLAGWRKRMLAARAQRVAPALDDKILTAWNGLMIASLARGARVLDDPQYAEAAARAADFVLTHLRKDGRLLATHRNGASRLTGYLTDYAFVIEGLLNLYEATFEQRWLNEAVALNDQLLAHYLDKAGGAFYFTADDAEALIARTKNPRDGAIPSGNSVEALNLLRLAELLDRKDLRSHAEGIFRAFKATAESSPGQFERLMCAVDFYHSKPLQIALVGPRESAATQALIDAVFAAYRPNKVVAWSADAAGDDAIALLRGKKPIQGEPAAYICAGYQCGKPTTSAADLRAQLGSK
ncbi:MAG: thioredoxin domain-containing protein [Phycisphaerales bacterium]|nr:thioredoxin domain-containing protein [Phycisphaerales bacterium]